MAKEIRENFVGVLTLVIVSFAIYGFLRVSSRTATANPNSTSPNQADGTSGTDRYLYAAVYSTKGDLSSTLGLNNTLNHDMTARVTLFNKHGQSLTTPAMEITLGPHKNHAFNVADWIGDHDGFEEGSLVVFFHGLAMALGAQEIITDAAHGLNFDVHLTAYDDFESPRVEGLWWALDHQSEAKVFFANTKDSHTRVTPFYYVSGTEYRGESVDLDGHESSSIDIEKELKELHVPGNITVGGITLKYTNGEGAIAVVGVIANKHTGFSTTMRFIDTAAQKTTTLHGANLPIGKAQSDSGFPSNTRFTPHVIVRNNTEQTVQIHARIRYTLYDQPNVINLGSMSLSANQVRELDLTSAINAIGNHPVADTGIEIEHNRHPGAIMAYAAGVDHSGNKAFDVPIKDPKALNFLGGSYPWNIAGDNHAVLHVKSIDAPTDGQKREFMVKLYFEGGEYNLPLQQVEAGQTGEVDIRKLRDDQVKDVLGHVIPLTVTGGQLAWYGRANKGEFIGRLAAYDPVAGTSSSFSCPQNCICTSGFLSGSMTPGVISNFAGATFPLDAMETDGDCNQANQFTYEISNPVFSSSNTDVVTISGEFSNQTATLVGAGDANITVSWDTFTVDRECTAFASDGECVDARCPTNGVATPINNTPVAVNNPTKLVRLDYQTFSPGAPDGYGPLVLCSDTSNEVRNVKNEALLTNQCGVYRNLVYELEDQNGASVTEAYSITENFSNYHHSTSYSSGSTPASDTKNISATGIVTDTMFLGKTLPNCLGVDDNESFDQTFVVTINGTPYNLTTVNHISRGRFSGTHKVDVTITTP